MSLSIAIYPSNDDVTVGHLSVGRQSEADPTCCLHTHCKSDALVSSIEAPVELVVSTMIHDLVEAVFLRQLAVGRASGDCRQHCEDEYTNDLSANCHTFWFVLESDMILVSYPISFYWCHASEIAHAIVSRDGYEFPWRTLSERRYENVWVSYFVISWRNRKYTDDLKSLYLVGSWLSCYI